MGEWRKVKEFLIDNGKGITPTYVFKSSVMVLNQKCIRNHKIDYSFAQYTDDTINISENKTVKIGDILFNSTGQGTAGRCAFVDKLPDNLRVITDSHILRLRGNDFYEMKCLSYALFSCEKMIQSFMDGSTGQGELDKVRLLNIQVKLTKDKHHQQKIASVLSALDTKIELNNKINSELEALAKTLYDYWFVQFDFPDDNGKPYKSSGGAMVYSPELKREIPKGWAVKNIGFYSKCKNGFAFKSNDWVENGIPVIKIKDINDDYTLSMENFSYVSKENHQNNIKFEARTGSIVIAMTGATIGKFAIVPEFKTKILVNQRVGLFDFGIEPFKLLPFFINSICQSYFREIIFLISNGAAQPNISSEQIDSIPLIIPKDKILSLYNTQNESLYKKIINNINENQHLASLRDFLLPMLMNGQVGVK